MELSGLVDWRRRPRPDSCGAGLGCSRKGASAVSPLAPDSLVASWLSPAAPGLRPYCVLGLQLTHLAL